MATNDVTPSDVEAFVGYCVTLRAHWEHHQFLFEGNDLRSELLAASAPRFFGDLNHMLIEHLVLQICKLTDPEQTRGRKNLTAKFLLNNSDFSADLGELDKLCQIESRLEVFRLRILPARNRLISHLDRESILLGQALGGADKIAWSKFWLDLQDFVEIFHRKYVDPIGHFYLNSIGMITDTDSLVKSLKESTYFQTILEADDLGARVGNVAFESKYCYA